MKPIIPIYFAIDDNYAPYLVVTLQSIVENKTDKHFYKFYILNTYLSERNFNEIAKFNTENTSVEFIDVTTYMDSMGDKLHLRDYYTNTTYYRMFLPSIAAQYDKILYLDSDIVVLGDIADLYNHEIGDNLVGAVTEDVMTNFEVFGNYVEKAIGVNRFKYFNAGILVMNTKRFRELSIEDKFMELIQAFKFELVQDEDYLNALCKGRVQYLNEGWNRAPIPGTELPREKLNLIHYKIAWKPWKYADVMYQDYFWQYAKNTAYNDELLNARANYAGAADDQWQFGNLCTVANRDAEDANNYCNSTDATNNEVYIGIKSKYPSTLAQHRKDILEKIELHEKNGWFDKDVEDDPETITLMPEDIEYVNRGIISGISTKIAMRSAIKFYEKLMKNKQFFIEDVKGLDNYLNIKGGKVITCNHFSVNDNYAVFRPLRKNGLKRLYKVIREGNYTSFTGIFGYFFKNCYTLPLSSNLATMKKFFKGCNQLLNKGETILIYPEQAMWYNYRKPRPLKEGAFRIAVNANVPIIPIFITMRDSEFLDADGNHAQKYTVHYLEPIYPKAELSKSENCEYLKNKNYEAWVKVYEEVYNEKLTYTNE